MKAPAVLPLDIRLMRSVSNALLLVAVLVCLAAGLWWAVRLPMFSLQAISVEGEVICPTSLTDEQMRACLGQPVVKKAVRVKKLNVQLGEGQ